MTPADLLPLFTFQFMLVFARLGTAVFVFPALSDPSIMLRARLLVALGASLVMYPMLAPKLPLLPTQTGDMLTLLGQEMLIGLLMGLGARILISMMSVAGEIIAFMSGLQTATLFNPALGASTAAPSVLLTLAAGLVVLALNLHHQLIMGVMESYTSLPPGTTLPTSGMAEAVTQLVAMAFKVGVQLSAPVLLTGFLAYLMFGIFNRLIPQLQVFFVAMPLSIGLSLLVLAGSLSLILGLFAGVMQDNLWLFNMEDAGW
ncbi:MAG: flagellar biosynthetic protein FliR [Pseudomonadaceae bacterium]|nr:flagellar biosynthetic protein FliR [Pseudomonadaceae bacterium]